MPDWFALSPTEFEYAVAELCREDGCTRVQAIGGAGDLGADVVAYTPDGRKVVTTGTVTTPAARLAKAAGIEIVHADRLDRWADGRDQPPWHHSRTPLPPEGES
ncbi:restriction endonuclease [Streptomyces sp. NPDC057837]|uniref:restriction endonuclease n=1 Tax=Streptomyces sp. NPDC057837 TaxID=3346260 RepID=UPI0036C46050